MPYIVMFRMKKDYYIMTDKVGNVVGYGREDNALSAFESAFKEGFDVEFSDLKLGRKYRPCCEPSILKVRKFNDIVNRISAEIPKRVLVGSGNGVGIYAVTTRPGAGMFWRKGRHSELAWFRHGEKSANTKLRGREAEVTAMLKEGMSDVKIGKILGVHYQTVSAFICQMNLR